MGYQLFEFGSVYFNTVPMCADGDVLPDADSDSRKSRQLNIKNTVPDKAITWVKPDNMPVFVSDRCIVAGVSWNDLRKSGLVYGRKVFIDGQPYQCRLLRVGARPDIGNEWDDCLDNAENDSSDLWHCNDMFFWGIEKAYDEEGMHALRGGSDSRYWCRSDSKDNSDYLGYRPVLELLPKELQQRARTVTLDGRIFCVNYVPGALDCTFVPILSPVTLREGRSQTANFNQELFGRQMNGMRVKMYTLLVDGKPVPQNVDEPVKYRAGSKLTFTDRYFGEEFLIPWTISNGMAIADKALLSGLSSSQLAQYTNWQ